MKILHLIVILAIIIATGYLSYGKGVLDTENRLVPIIDEYKNYTDKGPVGWEPPAGEYRVIGNVSGDFVTYYGEWSGFGSIIASGNESRTSHLNITVIAVKEDKLDHIYAYINREK